MNTKGPTQKFAFVSPVWTTWQHRFVAGALDYANRHSRVIIRGFAPVRNLTAAAAEVEDWGAHGVLGFLEQDDQAKFLQGLSRPLPLVNNALAEVHPKVVTVVADFKAFVETAVGHFRQMGLRSLGILILEEEGPHVRERLIGTFLKIARPARGDRASLICPANREQLWNPHAQVKPVPPALVEWLRDLPKPVGILTPELGGGGYVIRCCQALGLRVPEDVAVIGGDEMDLSLAIEPTLTCVVPALEKIGFEAVQLLRELVAGHRPPQAIVRLGCVDLQVRESTGLRRPEICDIGAALRCIHDEACRGISVAQLIKQTQSVSKVTFYRRFQAAVGKSPAEAIQERKLEEVRRLLTSTDLPLTMISDLCGFSSTKVLARVFRSVEATTPREFRKNQKPSKARPARTPSRPFANRGLKKSSHTPSLRPQKRTNGQGMTPR